jgi:hypothetical protein
MQRRFEALHPSLCASDGGTWREAANVIGGALRCGEPIDSDVRI